MGALPEREGPAADEDGERKGDGTAGGTLGGTGEGEFFERSGSRDPASYLWNGY